MAFIQYAMHIMMSLVMMSMIFVMLPRAAASADRINEVLETEPLVQDPEKPTAAVRGPGVVEFGPCHLYLSWSRSAGPGGYFLHCQAWRGYSNYRGYWRASPP